jgi:hypothetical protein
MNELDLQILKEALQVLKDYQPDCFPDAIKVGQTIESMEDVIAIAST